MATLTTTKIEVARIEYERLQKELNNLRELYTSIAKMTTLPNKEDLLQAVQHLANQIKVSQTGINMPTLRELADIDSEKTVFYIRTLVGWVRVQLNVNNNLNIDQVKMIAVDIMTTYRGMTLEEIAVAFSKGVKGDYGRSEFQLDGQTIHHWLKEYRKELLQYRQEKYNNYIQHHKVHQQPRALESNMSCIGDEIKQLLLEKK